MIRQDEDQFSDPSLRSALRRSFGSEQAPASLREQLSRVMSDGWDLSVASPARVSLRDRWEQWSSVVYASIAACVMLFGVTFLVMSYLGYFDRRPAYVGSPVAGNVPTELANAMIARHTACGKLHDHHLIPGDDVPALKKALEAQLGYPVAVVMPENGWVFKGAGRCEVGKTRAAHLLFERGEQEISVFSLPASAVRTVSTGSSLYQTECNGCPLAAAVRGAALYAAVGSSPDGSLSLYEVASIRDQFIASLPEMAGEDCGGEPVLTVAHAFPSSIP